MGPPEREVNFQQMKTPPMETVFGVFSPGPNFSSAILIWGPLSPYLHPNAGKSELPSSNARLDRSPLGTGFGGPNKLGDFPQWASFSRKRMWWWSPTAHPHPQEENLVNSPPGDEERQLQMSPGPLAGLNPFLLSPPVLSLKDFAGHPGFGPLKFDPGFHAEGLLNSRSGLGLLEGVAASGLLGCVWGGAQCSLLGSGSCLP